MPTHEEIRELCEKCEWRGVEIDGMNILKKKGCVTWAKKDSIGQEQTSMITSVKLIICTAGKIR
jgi:hypothetical protein